jgi:hypothetical protein
MRRLKVFSLLLSLIMLFTMSVFIAPAAEASGSGGDISNFGYGILTNNFNFSGTINPINSSVCGTSSTGSVFNQISGTQTIEGNILSGGTGPLNISGSVTQTGGNIYSDGPVVFGGHYYVGAVQSLSTITPIPTVSPNTSGTLSQNMGSLTVSVPTAVPPLDQTYYSSTCNPTVISASNISEISNGGTYLINGSLTLTNQDITITKPTTLVVTGEIDISGSSNIIATPSTGGLALIAFGGITVSGSSTLTDVLLWANGYTTIGAPTGINISGYSSFTGDVVAANGVNISGYVAFNQEVTIPVTPPLKPAGPTVTGINPTSGPTTGGTSVAITGTNFTGATAVDFGSTAATSFTVNSATSITATSPAGTGTVDVTVTTPAGTSATSSADQFTYVAGPTVTSINPNSGLTTGGTPVAITGTGFTGATAVKFGSTAATSFTVNSATSITATSPAGTGTVDVTVTTSFGTSATSSADQFTYVTLLRLNVTGTHLVPALENSLYNSGNINQYVTATGGTPSYNWTSPNLSTILPGLSMDRTTGAITGGAPSTSTISSYSVTVTCTDSTTPSQQVSVPLILYVYPYSNR